MKKIKPYLYTSFTIFLILMLIFLFKKIFPFGENSVIWGDMHAQVTPFYYQLYDIFHGNASLLVDFQTGGGSNFLGIFAYYIASPFSLLVLLFPRNMIYEVVSIIVMLKIILTGITAMYAIESHFKKIPMIMKIILSTSYALSGYMLMMYQITSFIDIMYLFPILMVGLKRLLDGKSGKLYGITLCISAILSFYLTFIVLLFLLLLSFLYMFFYVEKEKRKKSATSLGIITIGSILLSSFLILPALKEIMVSNRLSFNLDTLIHSNLGPIKDKISMFFPSSLCMVYSFLLFLSFKKHKKFCSFFLSVLILTCLPVFIEPINKMLHLGSYAFFPLRFGFIPIFFLMIGAAYYLEHKKEKTKENKLIPLLITGSTSLILAFLCYRYHDMVNRAVDTLSISGNNKVVLLLGFFFLISSVSIFLITKLNQTKISYICITTITLVQLFIFSYMYIGIDYDQKRLVENYKIMHQLEEEKEITPYRLKQQNTGLITNYGIVSKKPALDHFTSLSSKNNMTTLKKLGYSSYWMESSSNGGTLFTDALLGNKYMLTKDKILSSYYKKEKEIKDQTLYNNTSLMTYGYVLNQNISLEDESDAFKNNNLVYQAMTGRKEAILTEIKNFTFENIVKLGDMYLIKEKDEKATIKQNIWVTDESILYLQMLKSIDNFQNTSIFDSVEVIVNGKTIKESFPTKYENGLLELGTFKNENVSIELELKKEFEATELSLGIMKTKDYEEFIEQYGIDADIKQRRNQLNIMVTSDEETMLFLPITYDKGYQATVDGKKVEITKVLDNYIGISLKKGENKVSLTFIPEGLKEGIIISILSAVLLLVSWRLGWIEKIKNTKIVSSILYNIFLIASGGAFLILYLLPTIAFLYSIIERFLF